MEEIQNEIDKLEFAKDYYLEDYVFESNLKKINTISLIENKIKELKEKKQVLIDMENKNKKDIDDKNKFINEINKIGMNN